MRYSIPQEMATARRRRGAPKRRAIRAAAVLGLQRVDILKGLDARTLREIADQCNWTRYKRNQYVIRRDGADRDVYFVIAGMVRVSAEAGRGRQIILRDVPAGELFGEHSAIDGRAHMADVFAVRESLLASMPPEAFRAILANHASVREHVLRRLSGSVRELADRLIDLGAQRVQSRVWLELLRLARLAGVQANASRIERAPTHREIASHVGTSREEVTRELSRLGRKGLLERAGRALVLRDVAALEQLVAESRPEQQPDQEIAAVESSGFAGVRSRRERRAILVADAFDAVAMMERDEERAYAQLLDHNKIVRNAIANYRGREIKTIGDAFLVTFRSAFDAVECALAIQRAFTEYNADKDVTDRILLRIGIHLGDILVTSNDVFGEGVNIVSRIQPLAEPGGICVSEAVFMQVRKKFELKVERVEGVDLKLKNIATAPDVYHLNLS